MATPKIEKKNESVVCRGSGVVICLSFGPGIEESVSGGQWGEQTEVWSIEMYFFMEPPSVDACNSSGEPVVHMAALTTRCRSLLFSSAAAELHGAAVGQDVLYC